MTWDGARYRALGITTGRAPAAPPGIAPYRWWWEGLLWEGTRMASAFDTALSGAQTTVTGYAASALPVVAAVAVAFLGLKVVRRIIAKL